jgi:hypothetical protein
MDLLFSSHFWAHFLLSQKTGLSAPIFALQKFRSYPLRGPNGSAVRPFEGSALWAALALSTLTQFTPFPRISG